MRALLLSALVALAVSPAAAQTFTDRMNARHAEQAPREGEDLPDASGFTADGKPFALSDERGHTTVLVFGCLT